MSVALSDSVVEGVSLFALVGALALSLAVLTRLVRGTPILAALRDRFYYGVPWGTVIVVLGLYAVYYLLQGGGQDGGPIVAGFRSWSLWYPQGTLLSSFAHASESHLVGNATATIAFGIVVEYAWGHFPDDDNSGAGNSDSAGEQPSTVEPQRTDDPSKPARLDLDRPRTRIATFVGAVVLAGLAGALFVPGSIIGFSGVVFALAGFALVVRPLLGLGAVLGLQALRLVRRAFLDPLVLAEARPRFVAPSWADVALQGHLFGFLLGVLAALVFLRAREQRPPVRYVWFAVLVFAVGRSLWALYWFRGSDQYVLYQALGTAGVFLLASLVAIAVLPREPSDAWPASPSLALLRGRAGHQAAGVRVEGSVQADDEPPVREPDDVAPPREADDVAPVSESDGERDGRREWPGPSLPTLAVGLLVAALLAIALSGLAYNLVTVSPGEDIEDDAHIAVEDYRVAYVQDAPDRYVGALDIPGIGSPLSASASGVVVASDRRNAWGVVTSSGQLAFEGDTTIPLGDATWRDTVYINRTQWAFLDGNSTYTVFGTDDGQREVLFADDPAQGEFRLDGATIRIEPADGWYDVVVTRNDSRVDSAAIPGHNQTVAVGGLTFERVDDDLLAHHEETELRIARYRSDQRE